MSARILSLHIYPIKSCAGIDLSESPIDRGLARPALDVDRRQRAFMTQRQWPRMALIRTAIGDGALRVGARHGRPADRAGRFRPGSGQRNRHRLEGQPAARAAAGRWFSDFLGTPCRLYKVDPPRADRPRPIGCRAGWMRIRTSPSVLGHPSFRFRRRISAAGGQPGLAGRPERPAAPRARPRCRWTGSGPISWCRGLGGVRRGPYRADRGGGSAHGFRQAAPAARFRTSTSAARSSSTSRAARWRPTATWRSAWCSARTPSWTRRRRRA